MTRGDEPLRGVTVLPARLRRDPTRPERIKATPIPKDSTALCP